MEFGTFYQLPCAAEQSPLQRYEDTLMQIQHADSLGLDVAWLAELHFFPSFSTMPSPCWWPVPWRSAPAAFVLASR